MTEHMNPETPPAETPDGACPAISRRRFIAALGASVATVAVGAYGISVWGKDPGATTTTTSGGLQVSATVPPPGALGPATGRTLVVIEMGGGNDGLNTVVPFSSSHYHDLRGDLAIDEPLDLDGEIGLHPALTFLAERYGTGEVAIVEGIGYPDPDLSHFASMAVWWSGLPGSVGATGWLGRYLDGTVGTEDPLAGVTIGPGPTPALLGERAFQVSVQDMSGLAPRVPGWIDDTDELMAMWSGFAPSDFDGAVLLDDVRAAIGTTVDAAAQLNAVLDGPPADDENTTGRRRRSDLGTSMEVAAALVTGPNPPRVVYVHGWGDFDTHEGQAARHQDMMEALDEALREFFTAVEDAGAEDRVLVMTTSEFGRRPAFNGSGTDHGTAGAHFLVGAPVAGGRYGEPPSLTDLDRRGNMVHTVDYRSVFASVLTGWFDADAASIFGTDLETLPLLG